MAQWPKRKPWHDGERVEWNLDNGYIVSAVKFTGSYGYKENKWELAIIDKDLKTFVDPPADKMENILDDYYKADEGIYGYLNDPDVDRIVEMVKRL